MSKRPNITDIAAAAEVSTATVDRVLNRRPGVRAATMQRVWAAARDLGYLAEADLMTSLAPPPMRLEFLLPAGTNRYLRMLGDYIRTAEDVLTPFNVRCRCHFVDSFDPQVLEAALAGHGRDADGLAFMALEHPLVREAVNGLVAAGVKIVTLISDLSASGRAAYVGMDNRAAGRTAGYLVGRLLGNRRGQVAMIAGSLSYRGHEEREMGFLHVMREMFPALSVVGLREGQDDANNNYLQAKSLLAQHADLVGFYNIGGGAGGIGRALKETGRDQETVFVGHGLTPDTRSLLMDGTLDAVITQDPSSMVANCVRIFTNLRDGRAAAAGVEPIRISVIFRENLP